MNELTVQITAPLWIYPGKAAWYFVTLPDDVSAQVRFYQAGKRGFGSVRMKATIGKSTWHTSAFPDAKSGCHFLPIKVRVRKSENLVAGNLVCVDLVIFVSMP